MRRVKLIKMKNGRHRVMSNLEVMQMYRLDDYKQTINHLQFRVNEYKKPYDIKVKLTEMLAEEFGSAILPEFIRFLESKLPEKRSLVSLDISKPFDVSKPVTRYHVSIPAIHYAYDDRN